ncbi:hypothetical protein LCGC14_0677320 [marine sediment metagenome]|uniref:HNH nuclease domain-containing protein n=1 Tax=marine sediment metagenome TaxID=412755 RepID=A0A0F9TXA5_9ZZZZ
MTHKKEEKLNAKRWQLENKERVKINTNKWRTKNRDKVREVHNEWVRTHPEQVIGYTRKRLKKYGDILFMDPKEYGCALNRLSKTSKERDNYICQICNTEGNSKTLHAHHMFYKANYPQLSLNLNNVITLCKPCHEETHGYKIYAFDNIVGVELL